MNALVKFAFDNEQFIQFTPLLVTTHDPMIHPGKGVMGIRFNGVNNGELRNVVIENIISQTPMGSELGGKYTNIVTQQAPYMNGYSMNMVNGISLTFAKNVIFNGIYLNNIISATGLSFGIALWYDTQINIIPNSIIDINNVIAGKELNDKSGQFTIDSYPNLIPEACGIRIYDDELYQVSINYDDNDDNIFQKCIYGHIGCLFDNKIYSHIGNVDNRQCGGSIVNFNIKKPAIKQAIFGRKKEYIGFILILFLLIIFIIALIYNYLCNQYLTKSRKYNKNHERTPLLL